MFNAILQCLHTITFDHAIFVEELEVYNILASTLIAWKEKQ